MKVTGKYFTMLFVIAVTFVMVFGGLQISTAASPMIPYCDNVCPPCSSYCYSSGQECWCREAPITVTCAEYCVGCCY
jgi:hypothetical protein